MPLPRADQSYAVPAEALSAVATCEPHNLEDAYAQICERSSVAHADPAWILPEALALLRLGKPADALHRLQRAEASQHGDPQFWVLLGMAHRGISDHHGQALQAYRQALVLDPGRADVLYNLGNILHGCDPQEAERHYLASLALDPLQAACWHNLGLLFHEQNRSEEAVGAIQLSLQLNPCYPDAWCNLGLALMALDNYGPAERCFAQAISLDQTHSASHLNLGNVLVAQLMPEQALVFLERGLSLDRNSAHALFDLGLCHLLLGRFDTGWDYYEARLRTHQVPATLVPTGGSRLSDLKAAPSFGQPPLVVWSEQGLGDMIQFSRYLALLEAAGIPYEFHCPEPLIRLMREWLRAKGEIRPPFKSTNRSDLRPHCPLMSLPRLFRTEAHTIPGVVPYLKAPGDHPGHLRVPEPPGGLAVGVVWAPNPDNRQMYRHKRIPLELFMPRLMDLVELDLIDLHCLQFGADAAQLDPWRSHPRVTDWAPQLQDFADTAHVVNQLDLVITVDTAVAHLAGALHRPTWVLLPRNADFRWLRDRIDSPWYPGCMRLFRQHQHGDWSGAVKDLHQALDQLFLLDLEALAAAKLHR